MKQSIKKSIITAVLMSLWLFSGCSGEPAQATIRNDIYQPTSGRNVEAPETPEASGNSETTENSEGLDSLNIVHTHNVTAINITFENTTVNPMALSIEDAAQLGAQYIQDIFGQNINGMYVELEFSDWEHVSRILWNGAVSISRRNTLEHRTRLNELNEMFMERYAAGEDAEDIRADMEDLFNNYSYTPARFYFAIDAITGKRINIWQNSQEIQNQPIPEPMAMEEYIEREWGGDWGAAFEAEVTSQEKEDFIPMAMEYAQRHFNNTTVVDAVFSNAFSSIIYTGSGNFDRQTYMNLMATDETGREAHLTFRLASRELSSISTMNNDFIPMSIDSGEWAEIEGDRGRGDNDDSEEYERSAPPRRD